MDRRLGGAQQPMTVQAALAPATGDTARQPSRRLTSFAFALSGAVMGATSTGVNFFILIYYSQVLGLAPALAGLALGLALLVDGVVDPLVGIVSDRLRTRWGRRHPLLVAAILPMAASYVAIWRPPVGADHQGLLFAYLLGLTIILRVSISLFDVPSNALIPELTQDYEQRTAYSAAKTSLNWMTANLVGILMYAIWLADAPGAVAGSGIMRRSGYEDGALWIGGLVLLLTVAVPWALRGWIPRLRRLRPAPVSDPLGILRDVFQTYANGSILALLASAVFFAAGVGLTQTLWVYFLSFFWRLPASGVNAVQLAYLAAAVVAWWLLPRLSRGREKRGLFLLLSGVFWIDDVAPIALRLAGLMPANGSPALVPVLMLFGFIDGVLFNMVIAIVLSMLTDVVEDNLVRTGRREEGVVLAGQTLVTKASTAVGTVLGAGLLGLIHFPRGAAPDAVSARITADMGLWFVPIMWTLGVASTLAVARYRITRDSHAANCAALATRARRGGSQTHDGQPEP
jgi:Na+/melibiose symporter-like transporter